MLVFCHFISAINDVLSLHFLTIRAFCQSICANKVKSMYYCFFCAAASVVPVVVVAIVVVVIMLLVVVVVMVLLLLLLFLLLLLLCVCVCVFLKKTLEKHFIDQVKFINGHYAMTACL
jgi:hypothetical protein